MCANSLLDFDPTMLTVRIKTRRSEVITCWPCSCELTEFSVSRNMVTFYKTDPTGGQWEMAIIPLVRNDADAVRLQERTALMFLAGRESWI